MTKKQNKTDKEYLKKLFLTAFDKYLMIYGDFHFFEIMDYLWDYEKIPIF